jgi:putative transferase (TIGR04331 family)
VKRFLITTALEETWRDDVPVLFLGEWCRRHSAAARWSALDYEVAPYHWDDRAKLRRDCDYLRGVYERLLAALAGDLNRLHGVAYSQHYWRILVGPWLGYFINLLFDRWTMVRFAAERYDLLGTAVLPAVAADVPNDMADFSRRYGGDAWDHAVTGAIVQQCTDIPVEPARAHPATDATGPADLPARYGVRRRLAQAYRRLGGLVTRRTDAFLISSYLPCKDELRLQTRLGQMPIYRRSTPVVHATVDPPQREWHLSGADDDPFVSYARRAVPQQIPAVYLEGYKALVEQARAQPWPRQPRVILTSVAFSGDDVFKAAAGEMIERGSPLVIGQHGGHYGLARWSWMEDHETAIADTYLTWGWSDPRRTAVRPTGMLKDVRPLGVDHAAQSGALLVTTTVERHGLPAYSLPVSRQWLDYLADQFSFVAALSDEVRAALTVRLSSQDSGWDQRARWRDRLRDVRVDDGLEPLGSAVGRTRIGIMTYNGTTFLESFAMDVPTVIFWNPDHWELRSSAERDFMDLERVGIFHATPESAAQHVSLVWSDVNSWWQSGDVRSVLARFMTRYCHQPPDIVSSLEAVLRSVSSTGRGATASPVISA